MVEFATERTDRELLGRPVARYSAVFVSDAMAVHETGFAFLVTGLALPKTGLERPCQTGFDETDFQ